ncbi:MAG TPA: SRPBCC family protein [Gammaproteobacteria bacterium]
MKGDTKVERKGDRELVVTRTFDAPAHIVFEAWTKPELFRRWWVPKSAGMTLLSCELDVRTGGGYRLEFSHPQFPNPMVFFGKYSEVIPDARMVWTNEEEGGGNVTTLTFEEKGGKTRVVLHELYPSKEACDATLEMDEAWHEQFAQLDKLLSTLT